MKSIIAKGETYLGIELGSTRIKAVLIDNKHNVLATGSHGWENQLVDGIWTYSLDAVWTGLQDCYADLAKDVQSKYDVELTTVGSLGISAMMHGYMVFDSEGNLLVPFRTWRNTITGEAADKLTDLFGFNIPQRWSVAHLYQAILNGEEHVKDIKYLTTLSGYIHWKLTGEKVLGVGDASGMFPINDKTHQFDSDMLNKFENLTNINLNNIMPKVLSAGENAGTLTESGVKLLDSTGKLKAGIPMCPPEGDAGTGMVATNAVKQRTANISAGTSVFAMVVLEKSLSELYKEIDMVTTPSGDAVAMVHCNNCLGDMDAWVNLLGDAAKLLGADFDINTLYCKLYNNAFAGDADCGGLLSFNYISGEHITGLEQGRPIFVRTPDANFTLTNFIRTHLYSSVASLKIGMKILLEKENAELDSITGHGGFFKQAAVGQRVMSAAMEAPVTVMETAGEGGPWGMAVLAAYKNNKQGETLSKYLSNKVFASAKTSTIEPKEEDINGFNKFLDKYQACLPVEKTAVEILE